MSKTEEMLSTSYDSIGELSSLLYAHQHDIPTEFFGPEACRPTGTLPFDDSVCSGHPLPVLDLAHVGHRWGPLAAKLTEICEEWGFVQVINHGVPSHILQEMASFGHAFFTLPTEHKKRGAIAFLNGYTAKHGNWNGLGTPWVEALTLMISPESNIAAFEAKMWPDHPNDALRQTLQQFDAAMEKLEITLLQLLAEGLGLEATFFSRHFDQCEEKTTGVQFNYYPPCPEPSKVFGALPHTDPTGLTVLYEDRVSGLQIQAKDGSWHLVHHDQDSLLVFVGDILQGWSNGRFPAVVHRVVLNDEIPRLSLLHANSPAPNFLIQPAPVSAASRYKAFSVREYMAFKSDRHVQRPDDPRRPMDVYNAVDVPMS